ncbi:MAG: alpha/beta hydrolase [Candidatus Obscuribacterales bacterium]
MTGSTGILLLHGLTGMPAEMRPLEKHFKQAGFEVESPLLPGHGGTHLELLAASWQDWVEASREALDRLCGKVDRVVAIGLSMGGTIGGILAAGDRRIAGLVMLSPTLYYDGPSVNGLMRSARIRRLMHQACYLFPALRSSLYWTERPPYGLKDERLQRQITKAIEAAAQGKSCQFGLFRTYYGNLFEMNLLTDHFLGLAGTIDCPTLLLHSYEDTIASLTNAMDVYRLVSSKEKHLVMLTGCDHVMTLDLNRKFVIRLLNEFVDDILEDKNLALPGASIESGISIHLSPPVLFQGEFRGEITPSFRHLVTLKNNNQEVVSFPISWSKRRNRTVLEINGDSGSLRRDAGDTAWRTVEHLLDTKARVMRAQRLDRPRELSGAGSGTSSGITSGIRS